MQIIVEIGPELARELEKVAPARSRRRSEFVRMALRRAVMEFKERETREAYLRTPDQDPEYFDPEEWEPASSAPKAGKKKSR